MTFLEILDSILFRPLQYLFELIYMNVYGVIGSPGFSIVALSLVMNVLLLPLYKRADALQEEERQTEERLSRGVTQIRKAFKGDERMMILQTYYRQNHYKPTYVLRGAVSLMLEIPFFMAAYRFLSNLTLIQGVALGPIGDLGLPDGLLAIGGMHINVLPIIMTGVNLVSCVIFTKGAPLKSKLQLYGMAVFFLFFLYDSPSGLVFYWTLNNVFSLGKTIFYKLRNPQKLLRIGLSALGLCVAAGTLICFRERGPMFKTAAVTVGVAMQLPLLMHMARGKKKQKPQAVPQAEPRLFFTAGVFLALFVGAYIPLSVIMSSAQEFVDVRNFQNPLWFVVSSFCLAIGSFVVWPGVFYQMAEPKSKKLYEKGICMLLAAAVLDFMLFGNDRGLLNSTLEYEMGLTLNAREVLCNAGVLAVAAVAMYLACRFAGKFTRKAVTVLALAVAVMIGMNAVNVNGQISGIQRSAEENGEIPSYTMSKTGKNVVVIMLDRAMGEFVPYIFNEKPELQEQFDGFTVYSNVVAPGAHTIFSSAALMGGYEYMPDQINARAEEPLVDKQNEALKVMPVLFSENGFETSVFQPPYANYQTIPDLSIYADYPNIQSYNIIGAYESQEDIEKQTRGNMRNFFMYGLMKACPVALQPYIYGHGSYNRSDLDPNEQYVATVVDAHRSEGPFTKFIKSYTVLKNLPKMTEVSGSEQNTFMFMDNETTHEMALLQEPDYTPQMYVDNTEYDLAHMDRFTLNGTTLKVKEEYHYRHYEINMAAMIQLGKWFDYLRGEGVYDNTRIILVSDHGQTLKLNEDRILPDGTDTEDFYPILFVKDFGASGFSYSDTFMTIADVPTLATDGVIENPVNPFTGKAINSDGKNGKVYVYDSQKYDIQDNRGNRFQPGTWYRVDNQNMQDAANWVKVGENTYLPED